MTAAAQLEMLPAAVPAADAPTDTPPPSALHLIRAEIRLSDFQRWMGGKRLAGPDHAMHCLLTECYGDLAPKPFRLITPRGASAGIFYGYATAGAAALQEAASVFADPLHCRIMPPGQVASKPMPTQWTAGRRLGFEVRVRPTRRLHRPAGKNGDGPVHAAERDAWLMQALDDGQETRTREAVYIDWLAERLAQSGGAQLESAALVSFQRTRAYRKRGGGASEGPDALLRGTLIIANPAAFAHLLARGVGRHRAYGYGMLLLRPAAPPPGG